MVTLRCGLGFIYPYNARRDRSARGIGAITHRHQVTVPPTASISGMGRCEAEILTATRKLETLMNLPGMWIGCVRQRRALDKLILDLDSSASETYGRQEGLA